MKGKLASYLAVGFSLFGMTLPLAHANQINTGGATGAYHSTFCPLLKIRMGAIGEAYQCTTSLGSSENLRRIAKNPKHFGYSQLDVFALESPRHGGSRAYQIVRSDDARECVFAVTRNKRLTNYGELAVYADTLRFILPPKSSGSASTFEYLSSIDSKGLGRARTIVHANDTDEAIRQALADDKAVTLFVQFPDPENKRFKMIKRLGGHLVPVVDGPILDQKINGQQIYFAQETDISQLRWLRLGRTVVTACTPLVLFSGRTNRISGAEERSIHRETVRIIRSMPTSDLIPQGSAIARIIRQTREVSARARGHFLRVSRNARERARPFAERMYRSARATISLMIQKAQPQ